MEPKRLFGTNGVRGVVNRELTTELALELAQSIGTLFNGGRLTLGRDGRTSSEMFSNIVAAGLMSVGCTVYDIGMTPTPAIQYITNRWKMDGGVMVTASHNPPEYNGLKVMGANGIEIPRDREVEVERLCQLRRWNFAEWKSVGKMIVKTGALEEYTESIRSQVDLEKIERSKLKVVVDCANGVGALATPHLLREMGCRVQTINASIDGSFPGRLPEPTPENLKELADTVVASGSDFGVAHDGDADRSIFVDELGNVRMGDRSFALIEEFFLSQNPSEEIVTPVSSSQAIEEIAEAHGGKVVWTKVGSIHVSHKMLETGSRLGGEENGGIFYGPHFPVRDGAMTAALVANILASTGRRLSELIGSLPAYYNAKGKVPCRNELKEKALEKLIEETRELRVDRTDGVKIFFSDRSWVLVRPSGTEPIYRIFAEGTSEKQAADLVASYRSAVEKITREI